MTLSINQEKRIMVVENEVDLREMFAFEFRSKGFKVIEAANGEQALQFLESSDPDVVISDVRMEPVNGLELLRALKRRNVEKPVVILISAYGDVSPMFAMGEGAEAFLTKPFTLAGLVGLVKRFLEPPDKRWAKKPENVPWREVILNIKSIEEGIQDKVVDLGRGGLCICIREYDLVVGEQVSFNLRLMNEELPEIQGVGTVRWRNERANDIDRICYEYGIEFEYLPETCRRGILAWLHKRNPLPYIPVFI